jgi:hypothetical protein
VNARKHIPACLGLAFLLIALAAPAAAQAGFGIKSVTATASNEDGSIDLQAGSHPYEYTVSFEMNQDAEGEVEGTLRSLVVDLPPGLTGDPLATPRCRGVDFEGAIPFCPGNTQIGVAHFRPAGTDIVAESPVYNLVPNLGTPLTVGFSITGINSFQEASLRTGGDYGGTVSDITYPTGTTLQSITETIWGVPADPSHDAERVCVSNGSSVHECPSEVAPIPFLSLPTSCTGSLRTTVKVESLQEPGVFQSKSVESLGEGGIPAGLSGCDRLSFTPTITAQPETTASDSPTGLHVNLHIPQNEDPGGLATAHLKDTVVTLPKGVALNPSAADGLDACTSAQVDLHGPGPANCPDSSKVGTVEVETPLLDHPLQGAVYLAKQGDNPFNSLLALYIAVNDPDTGIVVKLAGKVEPDPVTGQLKTTFKENPQLPFEDFDLDFFGGPRASLTTPPTCGKYTTTTDLTPWSAPEGADAFPSNSFDVNSGLNGPCPANESQMPNGPGFEAGTATPLAGSYSPFVFKLARGNGSQRLAAIDAALPPGLTGRLAGVAQCSEAQIAAAAARKSPGEGAMERQSPSCPASSEVGTVTAGAGSGNPLYVGGHVYLAGPYKGAPLSFAFITPAIAGPFDLGTIVVRAAANIDPATAQISVESDPIPTILDGIPLDLRSIAVQVDRNRFTLNPTSCDPMAIGAAATSVLGQAVGLSNRFQVGGCKGLDYEPKLALRTFGPTKRGGHPRLRAVFSAKEGEANTQRLAVTLPRSEFLDQAHIRTVCTRVQFAAHACPAGSVYGAIKAFTPLLDFPLEGPVYLRSSNHKLPDLLAVLKGPASQPIEVDLDGRVDSVHGGIRNTFEAAPDAPVSKVILTMQGGKKGLLVNSRDVCAKAYRSTVKAIGHNGKAFEASPALKNAKCDKGKR